MLVFINYWTVPNFQNCIVILSWFWQRKNGQTFLISNVCAGNTSLCCGQNVTSEIRVKEGCSKTCARETHSDIHSSSQILEHWTPYYFYHNIFLLPQGKYMMRPALLTISAGRKLPPKWSFVKIKIVSFNTSGQF